MAKGGRLIEALQKAAGCYDVAFARHSGESRNDEQKRGVMVGRFLGL
jgi:hypothetical protein